MGIGYHIVIHLHMYVSPRDSHSVPGKVISVLQMNTSLSAPLALNPQSLVKIIEALYPNKVKKNVQGQNFNQPLWICTRMYIRE